MSHFISKFKAQQYFSILWLSDWSKLFSRISCTDLHYDLVAWSLLLMQVCETSFCFLLTISLKFFFFFFSNYIFRESTQCSDTFLEYIWSFCIRDIFNAYACVFKWKRWSLLHQYATSYKKIIVGSKSLVIQKVLSNILK